jgi:hypothetical protein
MGDYFKYMMQGKTQIHFFDKDSHFEIAVGHVSVLQNLR